MELWFTEKQTPALGITCKVLQTLHREKTPFQEIAVLDTEQYGRMLVLNGMVQLTIGDEFIYHEMLAHVPLHSHPAPRHVLIVGGGDGGTAREVLRHPQVEKVTLVEIDRRVVDVSRHFLPEVSCSFDDQRMEVLFEDGVTYLLGRQAEYDIILVDAPEPIGQAARLFSREFYEGVLRALRPDGIFAAQTESPFVNSDLIARVYREVRGIFPMARLYLAPVPTYPSGLWSFTIGSKHYDPELPLRESGLEGSLRYYNAGVHKAAFQLPNFVRKLLDGEVRPGDVK
ncbi:spermidine synthase SpeE [Thermacetogenium phaeum DSM 12270]|jgi:spermidine synthase|uniref:Polyamine aminopropyltransferase n=2 Tax=Thermacetogenium phaeum TaxID=85874 RepID=K4LGW3_THEPS|nr:polyamine aminopropyltransferase [Thermacetogenium phaeum]AFV11210.1 spermidine synthase SpeE [Thermacetogenium phaeum DSM 12270]KUK36891.1 MAG: Spermidine synthase [Thermacetogenium phaeum]MDN5365442.1 spermidine synthase [Thermacetogenium sp.]